MCVLMSVCPTDLKSGVSKMLPNHTKLLIKNDKKEFQYYLKNGLINNYLKLLLMFVLIS